VIAQEEVREAHFALNVEHRRMVMVDAVGEFWRGAEVAVAYVKVAQSPAMQKKLSMV